MPGKVGYNVSSYGVLYKFNFIVGTINERVKFGHVPLKRRACIQVVHFPISGPIVSRLKRE